MKKIIPAVNLLTLAFSFTTAQKTGSIKQVQVTAETIASQPDGEALLGNAETDRCVACAFTCQRFA